jgi:hypothetical protein
MAPGTGVPKIAENPADIPQTTDFFLSISLSLKRSAMAEVSPAPIWARGPSLPADPPVTIVMIVADSFTDTVGRNMRPAMTDSATHLMKAYTSTISSSAMFLNQRLNIPCSHFLFP